MIVPPHIVSGSNAVLRPLDDDSAAEISELAVADAEMWLPTSDRAVVEIVVADELVIDALVAPDYLHGVTHDTPSAIVGRI